MTSKSNHESWFMSHRSFKVIQSLSIKWPIGHLTIGSYFVKSFYNIQNIGPVTCHISKLKFYINDIKTPATNSRELRRYITITRDARILYNRGLNSCRLLPSISSRVSREQICIFLLKLFHFRGSRISWKKFYATFC